MTAGGFELHAQDPVLDLIVVGRTAVDTTQQQLPLDAPEGADEDELLLEEVLVEDVCIDGMCGVY